MKTIMISGEKLTIVDDYDFDFLSRFSWQSKPSGNTFYAQRTSARKCEKMHRVILGLKGEDVAHVDHINGDGLDNRRSNSRLVTHQQNHFNSRKRGHATSVFKGVYWSNQRNRWHASIFLHGKRRHIGFFNDEYDAGSAYDKAAKATFGEFARTNEMMGISR